MTDRAHSDRLGGVFAQYWTAVAVSAFGTAVTAVALPVLVVQVLDASPVEVGIVNAAQVLPYAIFGLVAGVVVDRMARRPLAIWASIGRALALGLIPVLWALHILDIWTLAILLFAFGSFSVFGFAATQSLLPALVPSRLLVSANSRLDQADAAAQTAGPALGGALVGLLGAPLAIVVDGVTYLVDAIVLAFLRVRETRRPPARRRILTEAREGLSWVYGHRTLRWLAVSTHVWFFANAMALTAFALLALRTLSMSPTVYGVIFAVSGLAMFGGAAVAPTMSRHGGEGRAIVLGRGLYPLAWTAVAVIPSAAGVAPVLVIAGALALHGFAGGLENSNEMGYRQAVTPDAQLGRVNATMRSVNRTVAAIGSLTAGVIAGLAGPTLVLWCCVGVFAIAFAVAVLSPLRTARSERT